MRLYVVLFLCTLSSLMSVTGCDNASGDAVSPEHSKAQTNPPKISDIKSNISDNQQSTWKVEEIRLEARTNFSSIFFLDEKYGWITGEHTVYRTVDGGNTWEQVVIDIAPQAEVADILFVTPSVGWIVLQKSAPGVTNYKENQFWLIHTGDGGRSWQLQHEDKEVAITHISFSNEQNGWMTGIKYIGVAPVRYLPFVLHTSDQGQHWMDVSSKLNQFAENKAGVNNDGIVGITSESPDTATVLTHNEGIYKTFDGGQNWQPLEGTVRALSPINIFRLDVSKGGLWFAGSAYSLEGIRSALMVEQSDKSWIRYMLGNVYFADALFISDQQVIACGSIPTDKHDMRRRDGLLLYSADGGHNWFIVYRNSQIKNINALAVANSEHLWAVGENGLILRIAPAGTNLSSH